MSGHMVALEHGGTRDIFIVHEKHPVLAAKLVTQARKGVAYALAPVSDATLEHFQLTPQNMWHFNRHECGEIVCCQEMH